MSDDWRSGVTSEPPKPDAAVSTSDPPAEPAIQVRSAPEPLHAAGVIALAWLPAILVTAFLPRYVPIFERWPANWEVPPLTRALMWIGRFGPVPIVSVGTGLVAL